MTRKYPDNKLEEIHEFLHNYKADLPDLNRFIFDTKTAYRKFHPLLIWQFYIDASNEEADIVKTYVNEFVSDLSQSLLSSLMGFYKPSRMMMRSAIENFMRVSVFKDGDDALRYKRVYELTERLKDIRTFHETRTAINGLISKYSALCQYVHTSSPMKMDKRIPFSRVTKTNMYNLSSCVQDFRLVGGCISTCMYIMFKNKLSSMHHKDSDLILDQIPRALKRPVRS